MTILSILIYYLHTIIYVLLCLISFFILSSNPQVANIALNTHFLSLLLRLLRGPAGAVIPSTSPGSAQAASSAYWSLLGSCRGLAATVLATTLR